MLSPLTTSTFFLTQLQPTLQQLLSRIRIPPTMYMPTIPFSKDTQIVGIKRREALVLKSAKKAPILVPFVVLKEQRKIEQKIIFKSGDDCLQDKMALQIISFFQTIFSKLDLPAYLYPYAILPIRHNEGLIECIPNTKSRHQLGEDYEQMSLYDYFVQKFGHEHTIEFQKARKRFVDSMAAYSVFSFVLNVKDRHNGNILIDDQGHVIHIDFGFMLDIAPGGKASVELSPFKLTREMLQIMGENVTASRQNTRKNQPTAHSEVFQEFSELVIRCYLACRDHSDAIIGLIQGLSRSGLPCFRPESIKNLKTRLAYGKMEREAVQFMLEQIHASYESVFTYFYDWWQKRMEGINM